MAELSDVQNQENEQVADAVVSGGAEVPAEKPEVAAEKPDKPEKRLSLREQLNASVEKVRKEEAERVRDTTTGKFVKGDAPEKAAPAEKPAIQKDAQPEASKVVGPPPGWSQESKTYFNSLPADHPLRKDVAKREEEVSNGFKKYSDDAKRYQEIEQVLAPVRPNYQKVGIQSDAEAIKRLFMWEGMIRQNPAQALQQLAQQYGVNLSPAQSSDQPSTAAQEIPPQLRPVIDQFGQVSQRLQNLETHLTQSQEQQVSKELTAFAKDKPHFEKVRTAMGRLLQSGMAADLDNAYQMAIWADPEIRKQMREEEDTKRRAEMEKSATEQALKARRAAVSPQARAPAPQNGATGAKGQKGVRGSILASIAELNEDRA